MEFTVKMDNFFSGFHFKREFRNNLNKEEDWHNQSTQHLTHLDIMLMINEASAHGGISGLEDE